MPRKKKISPEAALKAEKRSDKVLPRLLGMKDWAGQDGRHFTDLLAVATSFAEMHGFAPIKTPLLESYDLFKKSSRRHGDKEFYFLEGEKSLRIIMRPEMTQGMIRAYIENNLAEGVSSVRLFSVGPIFRKEKLQSGHYRESHQLDLEIIGDNKPLTEALLVAVAHNFFNRLGIKIQVQINSLGSADCRREYSNKLSAFYKERGRRSKLCSNCKNILGKSTIGLFDCQEEECLNARLEAPQIADYLSADSRERFAKTLEFLDELGIDYNFNPHLVRGLSYYNDTVFEFWPVTEDGSILGKNALGGGGRYDSLVEQFGGLETPALGLALGLERIFSRTKDKSLLSSQAGSDLIFVSQLGDQAKIKALSLFEDLQQAGFNVRQSFASDSLKAQLEEALAWGAKTSLILGRKEIMDGTILMRDMDSGAQETVVYKKIKERLARKEKLVEKRLIIRKGGDLNG